jgi:SAM-dependent methyltransferase
MDFDNKSYWNHRLGNNYNLIGVGDITLSMNYNRWSYKVTRHILKRLLRKYNDPFNKAVLDVGSGTGFVVEILGEFKKGITGIDISTTAIQQLGLKYPQSIFLNIDIGKEPLNINNDTFSICIASSVLYHIVDDQDLEFALKNIHRVLCPGGIFIFSDNFIHLNEYDITHQKCRSLNEYTKLLSVSGFEIVDRVPNYFFMNDPVDTNNKLLKYIWHYNSKFSRSSKIYDTLIWPILYPIELFFTNFWKESPAQEFMICRALK